MGQLNKLIIKEGFSLLGKYIMSLVMAIIVVFSLTFVFASACTEELGYTVYGTDEAGVTQELYTHMHADGDDTRLQEYKDSGVAVQTVSIYSDFQGAPYAVMLILSQICTLGTLFMLIYGKVYYMGDKDYNKVSFNRIEYDRFKGLKIGIVPAVFCFMIYLLLVLSKLGVLGDIALVVYRFANYHLFAYNQLIFGDTSVATELGWGSVIAAALSVVIVPLLSQLCYALGYKRIDVFEKMVFKKKKG